MPDLPEYRRVERTGPAIRAALREAAPDELPEFEAEFRIALAEADDDFDLSRVEKMLDRWWGRAHLRLNPPTPEELAVIERVRRGDFRGMSTRTADGEWVPLDDDDDGAQDAYDRSPEVREVVERGLAAPLENMHPRTPRRRKI